MRLSSLFSTGQTHRISLRLIWIGVVAAVAGALALVAVTLWCCQARKKGSYLASNQAACRSVLDLQSKRGFKRYSIWFEESVLMPIPSMPWRRNKTVFDTCTVRIYSFQTFKVMDWKPVKEVKEACRAFLPPCLWFLCLKLDLFRSLFSLHGMRGHRL